MISARTCGCSQLTVLPQPVTFSYKLDTTVPSLAVADVTASGTNAGGALVSNAHEPGTREHLTVLQGSIEIEAAGTTKRLKAADTARYVADEPHAIRNAGKGEARALLVVIHG